MYGMDPCQHDCRGWVIDRNNPGALLHIKLKLMADGDDAG
jgi:hypothetical protein